MIIKIRVQALCTREAYKLTRVSQECPSFAVDDVKFVLAGSTAPSIREGPAIIFIRVVGSMNIESISTDR